MSTPAITAALAALLITWAGLLVRYVPDRIDREITPAADLAELAGLFDAGFRAYQSMQGTWLLRGQIDERWQA